MKLLKKIKNYIINMWKSLWAKTEADEKAEAALEEAKNRIKAIKRELADVKLALKKAASESKDVMDAFKRKKLK